MVEAEAQLPGMQGLATQTYKGYVPDFLGGWAVHLSAEGNQALETAIDSLSRLRSTKSHDLSAVLADWMTARDESIYSSMIEGVKTTENALAWAQYMRRSEEPVNERNEALTLGAVKQIQKAVQLGEKIKSGTKCTIDDIQHLHNTLFENTSDRSIGGKIRDAAIWVAPHRLSIEFASFVAPPPTFVPALLEDLVEYINTRYHDPCLQAALVYCQFETIHPFEDGNGRTGRALIQTILNARDSFSGVLPISFCLEQDRRAHYGGLNATRVVCTADDWDARSQSLTKWLELFAQGCLLAEAQILDNRKIAERIIKKWEQQIKTYEGSTTEQLMVSLLSMPVFSSDIVAERLGVSKRSAQGAIRALVVAGIIKPTGGKRNRRFVVPEMVERLRSVQPDGGRAVDMPVIPELSKAVLPHVGKTRIVCGHYGQRSRKPCILPKGHSGKHRYS